ncbi:hypothetical protein NX722_15295 [Endozoicomonas gorgoniicola]|uniref:Uncharacterized protein n=1 Tax=Endozoicomonas gorgoniicola TaxID=1234144 RepID=A0ABT3MX53_9GAMM|nr:hypothetical protein [Endozoicomonas gorgoniicola]MCW7553962.1 hypothetical protein [Endozoicomonas gorgoniicola]
MSNYKWSGWGFLPLMLSKKQTQTLLSSQPWKHWSEGLTIDQIKDIRRFYTRSGATTLRPMDGGRYILNLNEASSGCLIFSTDLYEIKLEKLQLLLINDIGLIYCHLTSSSSYNSKTISIINRTVFSWQPRTNSSQCPKWKSTSEENKTLCEHISDILSVPVDDDSY